MHFRFFGYILREDKDPSSSQRILPCFLYVFFSFFIACSLVMKGKEFLEGVETIFEFLF